MPVHFLCVIFSYRFIVVFVKQNLVYRFVSMDCGVFFVFILGAVQRQFLIRRHDIVTVEFGNIVNHCVAVNVVDEKGGGLEVVSFPEAPYWLRWQRSSLMFRAEKY